MMVSEDNNRDSSTSDIYTNPHDGEKYVRYEHRPLPINSLILGSQVKSIYVGFRAAFHHVPQSLHYYTIQTKNQYRDITGTYAMQQTQERSKMKLVRTENQLQFNTVYLVPLYPTEDVYGEFVCFFHNKEYFHKANKVSSSGALLPMMTKSRYVAITSRREGSWMRDALMMFMSASSA